MGVTTAVEEPAERRAQAGRGRGVGPARGALVERDREQPLAVVRLARPNDQVQVQLAPAVHVAPTNLTARLVERGRQPTLERPAKAHPRVAHRRPVGHLAVELADFGPRLRIVGDRREGQAAVGSRRREPGGQEVLPGVAVGQAAADQPEREAPLLLREHGPEAGVGVGEHDLRLEPAGRELTGGEQRLLPVAVGPDQPFVLGAQAAEVDGSADHQRPLPGGRTDGERFGGEPRRLLQPATGRPRVGERAGRSGGELRRPAGELGGEDSARRPQPGARRIGLPLHLDRQPLRQRERRRRRE